MGHYVELQVGRSRSAASEIGSEGPDFPITFAKEPRIGELMLFDATCVVDGEFGRNLLSDRAGAVARFFRRLPRVRAALAFDPQAGPILAAFGAFLAAVDWPCVRLDTSDYRIVLDDEGAFDRNLEIALSALDAPPFAGAGTPFGGAGRYTPSWERLLNLVRAGSDVRGAPAAEAIYRGDRAGAAAPVCGSPYYWPPENKPGNLLAAYLPRRGAFTVPMIARGKRLLGLTAEQERRWPDLEQWLHAFALGCVERVKPGEVARALAGEELDAVERRLWEASLPLARSFGTQQRRIAVQLLSAMGFGRAAAKVRAGS